MKSKSPKDRVSVRDRRRLLVVHKQLLLDGLEGFPTARDRGVRSCQNLLQNASSSSPNAVGRGKFSSHVAWSGPMVASRWLPGGFQAQNASLMNSFADAKGKESEGSSDKNKLATMVFMN